MQRAWVALAVLSFLAAGCIGGGGSKSTGEATMGDLLGAASAFASTWDAQSTWFGAIGWEIPNASMVRFEGRPLDIPEDAKLGDGKASHWVYGYWGSAPGSMLWVGIAASNKSAAFQSEVPSAETDANSDGIQWATNKWTVDSEQALSRARENVTFAGTLMRIDTPAYTYMLQGNPEDSNGRAAIWAIVAMGLRDYERIIAADEDRRLDRADVERELGTTPMALAIVDAVTGAVVETGSWNESSGLGPAENASPTDPHAGHQMGPRTLHEMEASGQVTLLEDSVTFPLPVAEDGATIEGNFTYGQGTVPGGATMHVTAANGTEIYSSGGTGLTTKETRVGVFVEDVPAGDYTVSVDLGSVAVTADWTVDLKVSVVGMMMGNGTASEDGGGSTPSLMRGTPFGPLMDMLARLV